MPIGATSVSDGSAFEMVVKPPFMFSKPALYASATGFASGSVLPLHSTMRVFLPGGARVLM